MRESPLLKPFDVTIYKAKSGTDERRVPAAGATIDFYLQGATAREDVDLDRDDPDIPPVRVWHPGVITPAANSVVVDGTGSLFDVTHVDTSDPYNMTVTLIPTVAGNHHLAAGQRLIWLLDRPLVQFDPTGASTPGGNAIVTDSNGRGTCYLRPPRYDYIVTIGSAKSVYIDAEGSFVLL